MKTTTAFITILCLAASAIGLVAQESKNPTIMGIQLGDTVDKLLTNPEIQKLEEVETAFSTRSYLSRMDRKPQLALERYAESIQKLKTSKEEERENLHHPSAEKFWVVDARFRNEGSKPKILGLSVDKLASIARYHPESQTFRIHQLDIRLNVPESANPTQTVEAVVEALSKQFGQPTEVAEDSGTKTWKNLGETKTNLVVWGAIAGNISISLSSDLMNTQTTAAHAKRLAELQKPAPVTGTLE